MRFASLLCLFLIFPVSAQADPVKVSLPENLPVLQLSFNSKTQILDVMIQNAGKTDLSVYDSITQDKLPDFVWARVLDKDGHVMDEDSYYPSRYLNWHVKVSSNAEFPTPVKVKTITPGKSIVGHVPLNRILAGLGPALPPEMLKGGKFCVQFRVDVFTDKYLEVGHMVEKESKVTCLSGYKYMR